MAEKKTKEKKQQILFLIYESVKSYVSLTIFRCPLEYGFTPRTVSLFIEHAHGDIVHSVHLQTRRSVRGRNIIGEYIILITGDFFTVLSFGIDKKFIFD